MTSPSLRVAARALASVPTTSLAITTGLPQQLRQPVRNDLPGTARAFHSPLGLAHMGAEDDAGAVVDKILNGRHGSDDPLVARDLALLGGDVEVAAAKHALALDIECLQQISCCNS